MRTLDKAFFSFHSSLRVLPFRSKFELTTNNSRTAGHLIKEYLMLNLKFDETFEAEWSHPVNITYSAVKLLYLNWKQKLFFISPTYIK